MDTPHPPGPPDPAEPTTPPTPADLRALAARAEELATAILALQARLRAATDEPTRRVGFRLDEAAGGASAAAADLNATAGDLARIRGRGDPAHGGCAADWGVCPEHGNTLRSSGGRWSCTTGGCGRAWDYDRGGLPCTEPATSLVTDAEGGTTALCAGHTLDARARLLGAAVQALPTPDRP